MRLTAGAETPTGPPVMTWAMKVAASGGPSTIDVASLRKLLARVEWVRASLNRARRAAGIQSPCPS